MERRSGRLRHLEAPESVVAELERFVRRLARASGSGSPRRMAELRSTEEVRAALDVLQARLVAQLRTAGWSWAEIAEALGVRRQSAHHRFGP